MERTNYTLHDYLKMRDFDWERFPISSNAEMSKIAVMLATKYNVDSAKIMISGKALPWLDEPREEKALHGAPGEKPYESIIYMQDNGFLICDTLDAINGINHTNKQYAIPADLMRSYIVFDGEEVEMVRMARASRKQDKDKNQTNLF